MRRRTVRPRTGRLDTVPSNVGRVSRWLATHRLALRFIAPCCVALCCLAGPVSGQTDTNIDAVEGGLLPGIVPESKLGQSSTLLDRMRQESVPGLSIAVIDGGKIAWAKAYGVIEAGSERGVTPETLFLAGSISKPVAATGALRLVQEGRLALDQDVNKKLTSWKVTYPDLAGDEKVTLRRLLTHTAGLTVHGFAGYAKGKEVPSVVEVLNGSGPANSAAVQIDVVPGSIHRYSGGGYTVMQLMVSDVTKRPFEDQLAATVLKPFGMSSSIFTNPLPESLHQRAATGHWPTGTPVPSRWHTYPEMAAAGLWTTATDLATWAVGIQRAYEGTDDSVLNQATAQRMLEKHLGDWGLGPSISGEGDALRFSHGGRDAGFDGFLAAFATRGQGVAILINANNNTGLVGELVNAVARAYQWPGFDSKQRSYLELDREVLAAVEGEYLAGDEQINIRLTGDALFAFGRSLGRQRLYPETSSRFFLASAADTLEFNRNDAGEVVGFSWTQGSGEVVSAVVKP